LSVKSIPIGVISIKKIKAFFKILFIAVVTISISGLFQPIQGHAQLPGLPADFDTSISKEKIEPELIEQVSKSGEADFFIWMVEKADLSHAANLKTKHKKGHFVYNALRQTSDRSQRGLRAALDRAGLKYRPFYIVNAIYVYSGNEERMLSIAARPEVKKITSNHQFLLPEPAVNIEASDNAAGITANIAFIRAPQVWDLGFQGEGITLAALDTGMDWDHPAIINQYRGWDGASANHNYHWWDATGTYPTAPNDMNGHGTHVTGIMIGDDGGENRIGVSPGAKTVHCKMFDDSGKSNDIMITECLQWILAPWDLSGQNPRPDLAPHALNNSWGIKYGGNDGLIDAISALHLAGIAVAFAAGNDGPACDTLASPGDYAQVMTTGSVKHTSSGFPGTLSSKSSRGPSSLFPETYKPDVMAPGEDILSAFPGGSYVFATGTSMAVPHTTALVALMWSANPSLIGRVEETYDFIHSTALPLSGQEGSNCGGDYSDGPNNDWGHGTIDALAAVQAVLAVSERGTIEGTVSDSSGKPIPEAIITTILYENGYSFNITADQDGVYSRDIITGTYDITASKRSFLPETRHGLVIVENEVTLANFNLEPFGVTITPGLECSANSGQKCTYEVNISNTGNVTDTYHLSLSGAEWLTELDDTEPLNLQPGQEASVNVVVQIPNSAKAGEFDSVLLWAISETDAFVNGVCEIITSSLGSLTGELDLTLTLSAEPVPSLLGIPVTLYAEVTNNEDVIIHNVTASARIPAQATIMDTSDECSFVEDLFFCNLGSIDKEGKKSVWAKVIFSETGTYNIDFEVRIPGFDPVSGLLMVVIEAYLYLPLVYRK
jgi:subtilisin family serine protease